MADARLGDRLLMVARRLPPQSAIIARPYAMSAAQASVSALVALRRAGKARRCLMLMAGGGPLLGYDGRHASGSNRAARRGPLSMAVHNRHEAALARRRGVIAALISPVFATPSHPGAAGIGLNAFSQLSRQCGPGIAAIALGGMNGKRFCPGRGHGAHGWAGIDAFLKN
jgi:thiamine-phosphate pyrophosphorylase